MAEQKQIYRSMQGKQVDMHKIMHQNELTVAVGNMKVNARGDELGPNGQIIKKTPDTYDNNHVVMDEIRKPKIHPVEEPTISRSKKIKDVSDMDPEGNE